MDVNQLIQQAIESAKTNDRATAKRLLSQAVQQEPNNARAWYLLSQVDENEHQIIYCLQKVLELQPDSRQASARLQTLLNKRAAYPSAVIPAGSETVEATKPKSKSSWLIWGLMIFSAPIVVCLILAVLTSIANISSSSSANSTVAPVAVQPSTKTPSPTHTPTLPPTIVPSPTTVLADLTAWPCLPTSSVKHGIVTKVLDGVTVEVAIDDQVVPVRYAGISIMDFETTGIRLDQQAAVVNQAVALSKPVTLVEASNNEWYVFVDNQMLNIELAARGMVKASNDLPNLSCASVIQAAIDGAYQQRKGLWAYELLIVPTIPIPTFPPHTSSGGGGSGCNCTGPDLDCTTSFRDQADAQACYEKCKPLYGDIFDLDRDNDGQACDERSTP